MVWEFYGSKVGFDVVWYAILSVCILIRLGEP